MAHDIFGTRFISHRVPAWHSVGYVTEQAMTGREALAHIGGDLCVRLHANFTEIEGELIPLPGRSIVRHPTPDDPQYAVLGQAGPDYTLITPGDAVDVWDKFVGRSVETMGVLRKGALFFITTKLPTMDIRGDEVEQFLGICSPMDGQRSASAEVWPLRVVCQNTLKAAQAQAQSSYRIVHDGTAKERLGFWLRDAYEKAEANYGVLKETFELLAGKSVLPGTATSIIRRTYPEPRMPRRDAPDATMEVRMERFRLHRLRIQRRREMALALFEGQGTGMDTPAARGTLWGVYNALTETENYRKGFASGGIEAESARVAEDLMFGRRGEAMQRAFDACLAVATGGSHGVSVGDPSLN